MINHEDDWHSRVEERQGGQDQFCSSRWRLHALLKNFDFLLNAMGSPKIGECAIYIFETIIQKVRYGEELR